MRVIKGFPPIYKDVVKKFPIVAKSPGVLFTYGDVIFYPNFQDGDELPPDLITHETYHSERQAELGADKWWAEYLKSDEFRAQEELEAYRLQYLYAVNKYSRSQARKLLDRIAKDLSSGMYGDVFNFESAKEAIVNGQA